MSPEQLREAVEWERAAKQLSRTIARCTGCGLGYVALRECGSPCLRCGEEVMYWTYRRGGEFLERPESVGEADRG